MKAVFAEHGERPLLWTKPRELAPQAGRFLVDLLEKATFGYDAAVIIDWRGDYGWPEANGPMPVELKKPILYVCVAATPDGKTPLFVEQRIDIDESFNKDELMGDDLAFLIVSLRDAVRAEFEKFSAREK
jgi:hypothetical protein